MTKLIYVKFKLKSDVSVLDWEDDLNTRFLLVKNQWHIKSLTGVNIIIRGKIILKTAHFFPAPLHFCCPCAANKISK